MEPQLGSGDARLEERDHALATLAPFLDRLLPAMLRRHLSWRHLPDGNRADLLAELRQELRVDCLEHSGLVLSLPQLQRHQRWFRQVERWIYRHRRRGQTTADEREPVVMPGLEQFEPSAPGLKRLLPDVPQALLERLVASSELHGNGRCNATATARRLGLKRQQVSTLWAAAADRLGFDDEFLAFWQRRLAEALTGLAADLLLDRGALWLLPRDRRRPDPRGRRRRIRRIHAALSIRPLPFELRRLLRAVLAARGASAPTRLLAAARHLAADDPGIALWQFEAAIVAGDLAGALRAVRSARWLGAAATATALARIRVLEARGRWRAAERALHRARARHRDADGRLSLALAVAGPLWSKLRSSAAASSSSARGSMRAADHDGTESNQPSCK